MKAAQVTRIPTWQDRRDTMRGVVFLILALIAAAFLAEIKYRVVSLERELAVIKQQMNQ